MVTLACANFCKARDTQDLEYLTFWMAGALCAQVYYSFTTNFPTLVSLHTSPPLTGQKVAGCVPPGRGEAACIRRLLPAHPSYGRSQGSKGCGRSHIRGSWRRGPGSPEPVASEEPVGRLLLKKQRNGGCSQRTIEGLMQNQLG